MPKFIPIEAQTNRRGSSAPDEDAGFGAHDAVGGDAAELWQLAVRLTLLFPARVWAGSTSGNCFTAFVGANLFQSGFTKFCPLDMILKKMGVPETTGNSCA